MNMKKTHLLLIAVVLLLGLSACNRALSTPQAAAATPTLAFSVQNEPTLDVGALAQQTAQAAAQPKAVEATPEPTAAQPDPNVPQSGGGAPASASGGEQASAPSWQPTPGRPSSYALKQGEWPICIARRFNVNMGDLFAANGLNMNSRPGVGVTLSIPQSGSWSENNGPRALRAHGKTHYVQAGETIYSIACSYGDVDPEGIIALNGLSSPYTLSAGQTIKLP